jgi:hypothetical protein
MEIFEYEGYFGHPARCGVTVYRGEGGGRIVMFTELPDNPGTSVTNQIEFIAASWANLHALNPLRVTWIEHYPETSSHEETFDLVTMDWMKRGYDWHAHVPDWRPVSRELVEELIGL